MPFVDTQGMNRPTPIKGISRPAGRMARYAIPVKGLHLAVVQTEALMRINLKKSLIKKDYYEFI